VSIQDAARKLGVSEGAVRKRVARGTLHRDKAEDGRVYVYLEGGTRGVDAEQDGGVDANNSSLISQLRSEIQYLWEENQRKDAILLNMTETMKALTPPREPGGATEPPIKIEPAEPADPRRSEPDREDPERADPEKVAPERPEREEPERPERVEPIPSEPSGGRESATQRPEEQSWWRRMFGGYEAPTSEGAKTPGREVRGGGAEDGER